MAKKTYQGSCHCGAVQFEADIDLAAGVWKCNCSICTKARFWHAPIGADDFRLVRGADALTEYQFFDRKLHHLFCARCGVHTHGWGDDDAIGRFFTPKVMCLDIAPDELAAAPVIYVDGAHDDYEHPPADIRLL
jgi:hypothetical protein